MSAQNRSSAYTSDSLHRAYGEGLPSGGTPPPHKRIVVKAGTTLLTGGGEHIDIEVMSTLVGQIARLYALDCEVYLVTSGAVAAGRRVLGVSPDEKNLPLRQALAAIGQSHLMHAYEQMFSWKHIPIAQALLSRRDITDRLGYINIRNTLTELAAQRVVPIINENDVVAVEELAGEAFGDNDTLSALVANLVDADLLIILGSTDGLFTADPHIYPDAHLIPIVEHITERDIAVLGGPSWDKRGRGGMTAKLEAVSLAAASGVDVVIANGRTPGVIERLVAGERIGTYFPATGSNVESRKRWMISGLSNRGVVSVDAGAARALIKDHRSLLPAGVTSASGSFRRGDIVSIVDDSSVQIACGITNYSSADVNAIKGKHSHSIADILGRSYGDDVVHRNNMVIL